MINLSMQTHVHIFCFRESEELDTYLWLPSEAPSFFPTRPPGPAAKQHIRPNKVTVGPGKCLEAAGQRKGRPVFTVRAGFRKAFVCSGPLFIFTPA